MTEATVQGTVLRVVHRNEVTGWVIANLEVAGQASPVAVVGTLPGIEEGATLRFVGEWEQHPKFGRQLRARFATPVRPDTAEAIRRFLASGLVEGVGKVMADRLVDAFGVGTLEVIDKHPERLTEVEGVGRKRAAAVRDAWAKHQGVRETLLFLQGHGVGGATAGRILAELGERAAVPAITANPYVLADRVRGIGFLTADRIARSLGFDPAHPARIEAGVAHVLDGAVDEGHCLVPEDRLGELARELLGEGVAEPPPDAAIQAAIDRLALGSRVVREEGDVFPERLHTAELRLAAALGRLASAPPGAPRVAADRDPEAALADVERLLRLRLSPDQRQAVLATMPGRGRLAVVTGGPGTGKTTVVQAIVQIHKQSGRAVFLAAPTGRAANRLKEATGHDAATVHRLLEFATAKAGGGGAGAGRGGPGVTGWGRFQRHAEHPLECDVLVVDEASMVDLPLAAHLLDALPRDATLVLVGDADQLPSVGPGAVLHDVIASGVATVVRLDTLFRQGEGSLITENAHRLLRGGRPRLPSAAEAATAEFHFFERDDPDELAATVVRLVTERIPQGFGLDPVRDIQVLAPMHRGPCGAERLNALLQDALNPAGAPFARGLRQGDKVMQVRNDYDLGVFNGDIGAISLVDPDRQALHVVMEGRTLRYEARQVDGLQTAYAVSIHKSQGSEYPAVVVPVHTQHWIMLRRDLLYTAITRGKRLVVLVGSRRALDQCVRNDEVRTRRTRLAERLCEGVRRGAG